MDTVWIISAIAIITVAIIAWGAFQNDRGQQ